MEYGTFKAQISIELYAYLIKMQLLPVAHTYNGITESLTIYSSNAELDKTLDIHINRFELGIED